MKNVVFVSGECILTSKEGGWSLLDIATVSLFGHVACLKKEKTGWILLDLEKVGERILIATNRWRIGFGSLCSWGMCLTLQANSTISIFGFTTFARYRRL
jgi:hypothetical protein